MLYQVGVDNMCILVHALKRQPLGVSFEARVSNALVEVGPSITLASLSEVLAFAVGSFIPMPACRVFSMFAGESLYAIIKYSTSASIILFEIVKNRLKAQLQYDEHHIYIHLCIL